MEWSAPELPTALRRVLTEVADLDLQERFQRVFEAAAAAITQLRDLDLSGYEPEHAEEERSLDLLEQVAPLLGATVTAVNLLVDAIAKELPEQGLELSGSPEEIDRAKRAVAILRARAAALRRDVLQLGSQLRSPQAVADRWNFLNHLQTARGLLRFGAGEMVADAASLYAEVSRAAVIPEYQQDVDNAVGLRRTLHRLALGMRAQLTKLEAGTAQPLPQLLGGLAATMETLTRTRTWRELRAPDKKEFVRFRGKLAELTAGGALAGPSTNALKGFVSFLELLTALMSQRETLRTHDRSCLADLTAQLEQIELLVPPRRPAALVERVVPLGDRLLGRDEAFDRCIAAVKAAPSGHASQIQALREEALRLIVSERSR